MVFAWNYSKPSIQSNCSVMLCTLDHPMYVLDFAMTSPLFCQIPEQNTFIRAIGVATKPTIKLLSICVLRCSKFNYHDCIILSNYGLTSGAVIMTNTSRHDARG